ncbi:MAG: TlpA disulfide reductase family protein, partial [Pirellula sp.]
DETARRFSFRLRWDSIKRTLSRLGSNGLEAVSIREKSETQKNGLLIVNQGKDLEIESLVVTDTVQADSKSTELLNRLRIQATSVKQLSSIVSEGYEIGRDVVRFHDGDMISGSLVGYKEGWFSIRTESLDTTLECSAVGLNRVQMAIGERGDLAEQATLAIGTNRSIGQLRFGNAESPLFWRCTNAKNEARIDIRIPGRVGYFEQRALAIDLSVATDRLYLKNGDVLPCRLDSLRADALSLWTPFSGVVSISSDLVSAVDLGGATRRTEHAFTRESRDTLLTLPRNQRDAPFRQAILAKNGDLLRGNLISVSAKQIEIESRLEPLLIDRDRIASIIFLSLPKTLGDDQKTESDAASDSTSTPESVNRRASGAHDEIRLQFAGGFELNVRVRDVQGNQLVCHSKALGSCLVDLPSIGSVQTGDARSSGELDSFVAWQPIVAASPRWKTTPTETNSLQSLVGTKAPDFELAMLDGKRFRLSEYLGKVVILDFWATWCGPCVKSLPEYLDAMSEFSPSDVMFLGVNATETPDIVRNFISKRNFVGFNTLFDYDGLVSQSMQVTGIPHTVMIAPDGTIAHVHVGYTPTAASEIKALAAKLSQE